MKLFLKIALGLTLMSFWFFWGTMPDSAYKILPTYYPDPDLAWQQTPFSKAEITQLATPQDVVQGRINQQKKP